ncbi:MAG TPA: hypothetical protein VGF07_14595, partial [Stellaceae bacterium]
MDGAVAALSDRGARDRAAARLGRNRIRLPRFAELAEPWRMAASHREAGPDEPSPANLFRIHWYNDRSRTEIAAVPVHLVLPPELTGVRAPIVVALGCFFPLIGAHKV